MCKLCMDPNFEGLWNWFMDFGRFLKSGEDSGVPTGPLTITQTLLEFLFKPISMVDYHISFLLLSTFLKASLSLR